MAMFLALAWRALVTLALLGVIVVSLRLRAPSQRLDRRELRRLVGAGVLLYVVGAAAAIDGRPPLAAGAFAAGILVCALAVWLSRGGEGPEGRDDGEEPPTDPELGPDFDWDAFERELADYCRDKPALR
jgi:uncharacterized membrane protein YfcA